MSVGKKQLSVVIFFLGWGKKMLEKFVGWGGKMLVGKFHLPFQGMSGQSLECRTEKTAEAEKKTLRPRGEKKVD